MTLPCLFFSIFIPIFFLQIFTIVFSIVLAKRSDPYFPILSSMEIDAIFQICPSGPSNLRFVVSCISNLVISSLTHQSNCMFLWIMEIGLLQHDAFYKKKLITHFASTSDRDTILQTEASFIVYPWNFIIGMIFCHFLAT